jgi:hypothetical protein
MNAYQVRCKKVDQIHHLAKAAFKFHEIETLLEKGVYRDFRCHRQSTSFAFHVITWPGYLVVCGDIGEMMWTRCSDMFQWAPGAINSIDYFEKKVPHGVETRQYDTDIARATLRELLEDEDIHGQEGVELVEKIRSCERYLDDGQHAVESEVFQQSLFDGCDWPNFTTFNSTFLWCREAVLWFFERRQMMAGK